MLLTSKNIDLNKIVFQKAETSSKFQGYSRFDVKYNDEKSVTAMITTNSCDCVLKSYGIQDEINNFNKPIVYKQVTFTVDEADDDQCEFYNTLHTIAEKFAEYHKTLVGKKLPINIPFKSVEGGARMYCKLIQSSNAQIYTKAYNFDDEVLDISKLDGPFEGRPLICINFTVKNNINMRLQISELCVKQISVPKFRLSH
jgi:hypothetical protein